MEIKTFSAAVTLKPEGKFSALVCTFEKPDKGGDVVKRGAFAKSLEHWRAIKKPIPVVFDHQVSDPKMYIGEINPHNSQETAVGLIVTGQFDLNDENGTKVHSLVQRGTLRDWSFSALIPEGQQRRRPKGGRDLLELQLRECGPTLIGKGDTETLMVASAAVTTSVPVDVDQLLAPYRARHGVWAQRVARTSLRKSRRLKRRQGSSCRAS